MKTAIALLAVAFLEACSMSPKMPPSYYNKSIDMTSWQDRAYDDCITLIVTEKKYVNCDGMALKMQEMLSKQNTK